ncbi:MAG: biotin--[acetyl-CoA-carboxylase] ligase [Pseudomonadota bacterium]
MTGWPEGVGRRLLDETDSTNAEAARLAASGHRQPTWILARQQSTPRGRQGRSWAMPPGNFAATFVDFPDYDVHGAGLRSFVASLALFDVLGHLAPHADVTLKWPNDVLLEGGKVAGILLESTSNGRNLQWLAIGIGVNLASTPDPASIQPGTAAPISVADARGHVISPEAFLDRLANAFAQWDTVLRHRGFEPVRAAWVARAARLGETIEARLPGRSVTGVFDDVDATGALVLRTPTGREEISAADVYFPG